MARLPPPRPPRPDLLPDRIDPGTAAYYALIAVCFTALGALLTGDLTQFTIAERGTVLGGIVAVLGYVAWRGRKKKGDDDGPA